MINNLFKYYKNNLTFEGAVIRENGFWKNSPFYLLLLTYIGFVISFTITHSWYFGILAIIFFISSALASKIINASFIKVEFNDFWVSKFSWSRSEFNNMFLDKLEKHLKNKDDNQLDIIQELIKERANRTKIHSIVFMSTFAGLFIPLWNSYINTVMNSMKKEEIVSMTYLFLIFLLLIISVSLLSPILADIRDILITQYMKWNKLNDLISEMRLRKNSIK